VRKKFQRLRAGRPKSQESQCFTMSSKRKRKEDPQESAELCNTCRSMTSSIQGLQALMSEEGYKHLGKKMMAKSAKQGCPLCTILRSYRGNRHAKNDEHNRVFVELENPGTDGHSTKTEHPFGRGRIKRLLVNSPPGRFIYDFEMCAFTTSSECLIKYTIRTCLMLRKMTLLHNF
jgi:hypothetical protein